MKTEQSGVFCGDIEGLLYLERGSNGGQTAQVEALIRFAARAEMCRAIHTGPIGQASINKRKADTAVKIRSSEVPW